LGVKRGERREKKVWCVSTRSRREMIKSRQGTRDNPEERGDEVAKPTYAPDGPRKRRKKHDKRGRGGGEVS